MSNKQKIQDDIRERIERARRGQSKVLDLSGYDLHNKLEEVPEEVFDIHQLENLILYYNGIHEVPERIRELTNLKHLNVVKNPITKVPDIPGLTMDWASYVRCQQALSKENVEGIWINIDDHQDSLLNQIKKSNL